MYRHSKITFLIILFLGRHVLISTMDQYVCFAKGNGWCDSNLVLCNETSVAYNLDDYMTELTGVDKNANCDDCKAMNKTGMNFTGRNILNSCNDKDICSLAATTLAPQTHTTIFKLTYSCRTKGSSITSNASSTTSDASRTTSNARSATPIVSTTASNVSSTTLASLSNESTELQFSRASTNTFNPTASTPTPSFSVSNTKLSTEGTPSSTDPDITSSAQVTDNRNAVTIVVSVVAPITTAVVVVSIIMYRRGHCKLLVGICTKRFEKHSAERADAYALSSTANANPTYNFSNDVHLNGCDVDYTEIDKIIKEPDVEYNHLNLIKKEAVHEPTYNHIGHLNSSSGNTEQTYDHVGNETLQKTDLSTLQQDTHMYSHIGALAKPASEQMVEDSYAHINGVMKDPSTFNETNQYDVASFHLNVGPAGDFGN